MDLAIDTDMDFETDIDMDMIMNMDMIMDMDRLPANMSSMANIQNLYRIFIPNILYCLWGQPISWALWAPANMLK